MSKKLIAIISMIKGQDREYAQHLHIPCWSSHIRMEIITYLKRPDLKQELLTAWQSNYNAIPNNLRNEAIMIAEQHQCVDVSTVDKLACILCVY